MYSNVLFKAYSVIITGLVLFSKSIGLYPINFNIDGWYNFEIIPTSVESLESNSLEFSTDFLDKIFAAYMFPVD